MVNLLEDEFTVWVVNAHHIKTVPGRKTDVKDAEWIVNLLRHGLLRPSFIPERAQRELREFVRYRQSLVQERSREANRIQKVIEGLDAEVARRTDHHRDVLEVVDAIPGVGRRTAETIVAEMGTDYSVLG